MLEPQGIDAWDEGNEEWQNNEVTLVHSSEDYEGGAVEVYRVRWPSGRVTYTLDTRDEYGSTVLVSLDTATAQALAQALAVASPALDEPVKYWPA